MTAGTAHSLDDPTGKALNAILARYKYPDARKSVTQLITSFVPFVMLWVTMVYSLRIGYWLTLLIVPLEAAFVIRLFIIQHDCGHGAFFRSQRLNNFVGFVIGVITLVPYTYWKKTHAIHHKTSGDLDHRTFGDIDTYTVREYLALTRLGRLRYRMYRNPVVMFLIGPAYQFIFKHRYPWDIPRSWKREWASIHMTNIALAVVAVSVSFVVGWRTFLLVQIPVTLLAGTFGVWLFYVQHQFEDTYWRDHPEWDFFDAGLQGSSYYELPPILKWFTGDIGLHHIHHVSSKIPNYRLQECFDRHPELQQVTRLDIKSGWASLRMALWDEDSRRLISFRELGAHQRS